MGKKKQAPEERQLMKIEETSLEETQLAEQLYNSAGLDPVVDAGLKDYDERIQLENKLISKVLGPRGSDIRGYGEAVAKRVAFAVYALLNKQYGGKVGDLRSYMMSLEEERDHSNRRYDDLMGRVIGILGDEYKELRTDSKEFIEKLTATLGEDLKDSKIDQKALAERLADIDGLRSQIITLNNEKEQISVKHEAQTAELKSEHKEEIRNLEKQIDTLNKEQAQLMEKHEVQTAELKNERKEERRDLGAQIKTLAKEKEQLKERSESQIIALKKEHNEEKGDLRSQLDSLDARIKELESAKTTLTSDLTQVRKDYNKLKTAIATLTGAIPYEEIGGKLGEELYAFLLEDSKVPDMVIDGVGKFIDFRKYLGIAARKGAEVASKHAEIILSDILKK